MPLYGYHCDKCSNRFEEFVRTQGQANCRMVTPNSSYAICPKCKYIAKRSYKDTHLGSRVDTKDTAKAISLLGRPTADPDFGGRKMINADRVKRHGPPPESSKRSGPSYTFVEDKECDCDFCMGYRQAQEDLRDDGRR